MNLPEQRGAKWARRSRFCWLVGFGGQLPCEGRTDRAHLIAQQTLKRLGHGDLVGDPRTWVPACRKHHTAFDDYRLSVPREGLPEALESLCEELGLSWYLDRRYGLQVAV
jgi:hypothetical protein